jgi:hypothetical protein
MSDKNIMSMFHKKIKKIVIVMDEIDCMNNGDKGGINSLIKIIRPKKTKKQKLEDNTLNPIICIGNYHIDKKIKELMKVCNVIELKPPTIKQIQKIISLIMPNIEKQLLINISEFVQNDLKKLVNIYEIYKKNSNILKNNVFNNILKKKSFNDDTKEITNLLFNNKYSIYEHNNLLNDASDFFSTYNLMKLMFKPRINPILNLNYESILFNNADLSYSIPEMQQAFNNNKDIYNFVYNDFNNINSTIQKIIVDIYNICKYKMICVYYYYLLIGIIMICIILYYFIKNYYNR